MCAADELRCSTPVDLIEEPLGVTITEASIWYCVESEALLKANRLQEVIKGGVALYGFFGDVDVVGCKANNALGLVLRRYAPLAKADCPGTATN
jgi:hypothetical protein